MSFQARIPLVVARSPIAETEFHKHGLLFLDPALRGRVILVPENQRTLRHAVTGRIQGKGGTREDLLICGNMLHHFKSFPTCRHSADVSCKAGMEMYERVEVIKTHGGRKCLGR
jgi:hypothetical protein